MQLSPCLAVACGGGFTLTGPTLVVNRKGSLLPAFGTILWPKLTYFGRKKVIPAKIPSFGCFRLSAKIADFEAPLSVSAETLSVDH